VRLATVEFRQRGGQGNSRKVASAELLFRSEVENYGGVIAGPTFLLKLAILESGLGRDVLGNDFGAG